MAYFLCGFVQKFFLCLPNFYVFYIIKFSFKYFMENLNPENQIQIELSDEMAEGIYSNLAIISHSASEFIVDFVRIMPGVAKAKVKSRIILTPEHAKRLLQALGDNIERFEQQNGIIRLNQEDPGFIPPLGGVGMA